MASGAQISWALCGCKPFLGIEISLVELVQMEMEGGSTCVETESAGFIRLAKRAVVYCICGQGGLALAVHSPEIEKSRGLLRFIGRQIQRFTCTIVENSTQV
jgi:hypothetical protein